MKRTACFILSLLLIFSVSINAFAYDFAEDTHFKIELPENYTRVGELEFIDSNNSDSSFSASYEENKEGKCIEDMSQEDIEKETEEFIKEAKKMFDAYSFKGEMKCISSKKIKHPSGMTACVRTFKTTCELTDGNETRYQKMYFFTGAVNNYIFSYDVKDEGELNKFDNYFDTIEINEAEARSLKDKILTYGILAIVIFLMAFGIIKFISSPANRQEENDKGEKSVIKKDKEDKGRKE